MASCELKPVKGDETLQEEGSEEEEQSSDFCAPDESDEDPTFDILDETRSALSKISLKKSKSRDLKKEIELGNEDGAEPVEVEIPELNEKDGKCFEMVEKLIKDGQLEKLKVDQCKVYLRKYGLRLTGNKDVLLERIREHLEVKDGGGEKKYPISSFVLNCKGDACTSDVVLFEQNVYEMFSIASRSATGPSIGTRLIAGRIVKESYGAAKQQHTFTIEVLWSKGEKPLPPLHPLLIKGRNLYRLKTMRQKWADEEQRKKILQEKHARGSIARCARENRIQQKEVRKINRIIRMEENKGKHIPAEQRNQHQPNPLQTNRQLKNIQPLQQSQHHPDAFKSKILKQIHFQNESQIKSDKITTTENYDNSSPQKENYDNCYQVTKPPTMFQASGTDPVVKPWNFEFLPSHDLPQFDEKHNQHHQQPCLSYSNSLKMSSPRPPLALSNYFNGSLPQQPSVCSNYFKRSPPQHHCPIQRQQLCRFYRQGRCYFGDNCKYRHD
ncbi:zinc finger CCCH domain-containing protein 62-like [Phoenix dactylifera]|uniref:Zinc finger CCCH domain-containing protein 62-like n=1 Tax=Phoenix dactylifera TaxID=42345 RepID=A0A8B7CJT4_PHODC|nr:zinc finger CCCH domain-containing protein 62-like [Phoenix dactylifera]